MKIFVKFIPSLIALILLITGAYLLIKRSNSRTYKEIPNNFKAKISRIKKQYRGRYDLEVTDGYSKSAFIRDRNFAEIVELISVGDSIIRDNDQNCPYFKSKNQIVQRCYLEYWPTIQTQ
jgi:hypothetical protein